MSRNKTELNPKSAERVKTIIDREKISQIEFSKRIHQSQQNISRIVTMKSALTKDNAQAIVTAFPEYRIEWLLGIDDYMTARDAIDGFIKRMDREHDDNIDTARHLAKLRNIEFNLYSSGIIQDENGRFLDCFLVRKDGKKAYITYNDLNDLISDLAALTESRLTRMIEKANK